MDDRTLEASIEKVLRSPLTASPIEFLWHAGEPLVVGLDFYRRVCRLISMRNPRQLRVRQKIQTNGTLINNDWCRFLSEESFGVGISVDGPQFLHDQQRPNWGGRGSHRQVMRGVELLQQHQIPFGALCVLTSKTLDYPDELYHFFRDHGFSWLGFNVEEVEAENKASTLMSRTRGVDASTLERFRKFLSRVFDLWRHDSNRMVIREFRDMLAILEGKLADSDARREPDETEPLSTVTIHRDGAISTGSPEFASSRDPRFNDFVFGNINQVELEDVLKDRYYRKFQSAVRSSVRRCAETCLYFDLCGGGYLSNKHAEHGRVDATETVTCKLHRQMVASVIIEELSRTKHAPIERPGVSAIIGASSSAHLN